MEPCALCAKIMTDQRELDRHMRHHTIQRDPQRPGESGSGGRIYVAAVLIVLSLFIIFTVRTCHWDVNGPVFDEHGNVVSW